MTKSPNAIPLRPDYSAPRRATISPADKLATAYVVAFGENNFIDAVIDRDYGDDRAVKDLHTKAAATISSTSSITSLSMTGAPAEFFGGLASSSAGVALLSSEGAIQLKFEGLAAIDVATILSVASSAGFVLEGDPISVRQMVLSNGVITPRKFAAISVYNREVLKYGRPSIEKIIRAGQNDAIQLALDTALFDATAGDSTRCAGLRNGISANATGASTATLLEEAMYADLETVISAVSAVANNGPIVIVASVRQAVALRLRVRSTFPYPILSTSGLADGVIMAISTNCLISAIDPTPRFDVSDQGTLHLDTAPSQIATVGTPNTVAAKVVSLFQQDQFAVRALYNVAWGLRSASGLSWLGSVKW